MAMALTLLRRCSIRCRSVSHGICSKTQNVFPGSDNESTQLARPAASTSYIGDLSPLGNDHKLHLDGCNVELVDDDAWRVSSALAGAWRGFEMKKQINSFSEMLDEAGRDHEDSSFVEGDPDLDEIDNMRIHGDLFYQIDRGSKEFEECKYDFHRKKPSRGKEDKKERESKKEAAKKKEHLQEIEKKENPGRELVSKIPNGFNIDPLLGETNGPYPEIKRERTLTFNQLTAPYHYPFCMDIYISKASVRACIVHRATSKVVAVAHSISKDMKFDLASTRNASACAAVGGILAQRALADDIHDVIYTPRKGEILEGKLQIVLQAVINNGVNVKVKLKQRKLKKTCQPFMP